MRGSAAADNEIFAPASSIVLYLYYLYYSGTAAALPLAVRHNKKGGGDEDALIATNLDDNVHMKRK